MCLPIAFYKWSSSYFLILEAIYIFYRNWLLRWTIIEFDYRNNPQNISESINYTYVSENYIWLHLVFTSIYIHNWLAVSYKIFTIRKSLMLSSTRSTESTDGAAVMCPNLYGCRKFPYIHWKMLRLWLMQWGTSISGLKFLAWTIENAIPSLFYFQFAKFYAYILHDTIDL